MNTLSGPSLGLLIEVAADTCTHDHLATLLLRADLEHDEYLRYGLGGSSKQGLVRQRLRGAQVCAQEGDNDAHRALLTFVRLLVERNVRDPEDPPRWFSELRESLLGDGYQLTWETSEVSISEWGIPRSQVEIIYRIVPTDSGPVPLADEITALEHDLGLRGYSDAVTHYRQAVNNFGQHQYEAANGQLRTMLEALIMNLAKDETGYIGQGQAGEGGQAINHIVTKTNALPKREGGLMLQGLWQMTHTNGPHPGQSTADEARMRMQLITATARFLLSHFSKSTSLSAAT